MIVLSCLLYILILARTILVATSATFPDEPFKPVEMYKVLIPGLEVSVKEHCTTPTRHAQHPPGFMNFDLIFAIAIFR